MSKNAHTGGVTNKKWKSERKENPIFNRSCGTRLFQHIWSVKFARGRWLSKKAGKTFQLYVPFPDFVDIDLIIRGSHLIACGRWRGKEVLSEAGAAGHLLGFHWGSAAATLPPGTLSPLWASVYSSVGIRITVTFCSCDIC